MLLSDVELRKLATPAREKRLSDGDHLSLVLKPSGKKIWRYRYRQPVTRLENTITLGYYPTMTLSEARVERDKADKKLEAGIDPGAEKRALRVAKETAEKHTFAKVALGWLSRYKLRVDPGTYEKTSNQITDHLLPTMGDKPISLLKTSDALELLRAIEAKGHIETTHRCRSHISRIFQFAATEGLVTSDITWPIKGDCLLPVRPRHHPGLTVPSEIGELLLKIDAYPARSVITHMLLKISPHVALRPTEIREGEWSEINFTERQWCIPAERMKGRLPHMVPLSDQVFALLKQLHAISGHCKLMFPSYGEPEQALSENTVNKALRKMGYCTRKDQSAHGFRTTFSTRLNEEGKKLHAFKDWIEIQLAHAEGNKVREAYNQAHYLEDRILMMQAWSNYLDDLRMHGRRIRTALSRPASEVA